LLLHILATMKDQGPGESAAETAIFQVLHRRHSLPEEVLYFEGDQFPTCKVCGNEVKFRMLRRSTASRKAVAVKAAKAGK
jgi:hypothetical protein